MLCAIWYHLYNSKNVKNTHGGLILFAMLQDEAFFVVGEPILHQPKNDKTSWPKLLSGHFALHQKLFYSNKITTLSEPLEPVFSLFSFFSLVGGAISGRF